MIKGLSLENRFTSIRLVERIHKETSFTLGTQEEPPKIKREKTEKEGVSTSNGTFIMGPRRVRCG